MPSGHRYCHDFALWLHASPDFSLLFQELQSMTAPKWNGLLGLLCRNNMAQVWLLLSSYSQGTTAGELKHQGQVGMSRTHTVPNARSWQGLFWGLGCKWLLQPMGLVYMSPGGYFVRKPGWLLAEPDGLPSRETSSQPVGRSARSDVLLQNMLLRINWFPLRWLKPSEKLPTGPIANRSWFALCQKCYVLSLIIRHPVEEPPLW